MVEFEIQQFTGNKIPGRRNEYVMHWAVFVINQLTKDWIFLKAFYSEFRAQDFINDLKNQIAKGDYSCLTLKG